MPAQTGSRAQNKAETRLAIQRAAVELFEERGYDATTVDDIARRADVAPRTFFRYFPNKELTLFSEDISGRLATLVTEAPAELDVLTALRWAVTKLMDYESTPLDRRRQDLRRRYSERPAIERHLAHLYDMLGTRLRDAFAARLGDGNVGDLRPDVAVAVYFGLAREFAKGERPAPELIERWFTAVTSLTS
ncbi:TetR/AcrR family transcriptional regulator [Pseudonocardia parietis]|uniref:AcrR family transcriptional regulator n=1 Tax=Pseudonocardia parietis TaxID=570936 RepID=A0ABS4W6P4_9PSEU|nr:TetR/AcrR family transcriptional regulator [Pseudonocardia parietis]MBP2371603.1 AcrR family transcriptional regulator [Pseudonocardia parietis]